MTIQESVFENKQFVLDLPVGASMKEKNQLKKDIIKKKGVVSYIVNKKTDFLIRDIKDEAKTFKFRTALKYKVPLVTVEFINDCIEANALLDPSSYFPEALKVKVKTDLNDGRVRTAKDENDCKTNQVKPFRFHNVKVFKYKDEDGPSFHFYDYALAKVILLKGKGKRDQIPFTVLEIHVSKVNANETISRYCVFLHNGILASGKKENESKICRYFDDVDEVMMAFNHLYKIYTNPPNSMVQTRTLIHEDIGSNKFLPNEWLSGIQSIDPEVTFLINYIWNEAELKLEEISPVTLKELSYDKLETAKMLLWRIITEMPQREDESQLIWKEFYKYFPHKEETELKTMNELKHKIIHCQVLLDMISANETNMKYQALHCNIEALPSDNEEVKHLISMFEISEKFIVDNVFKLHHYEDSSEYDTSIGNEKLLLHPTTISDLIGILPRGLSAAYERYFPVEDLLSDPIEMHFFDNIEACLLLTPQSKSRGSRVVLINQVALGNCKKVNSLNDIQNAEDCDSFHCVGQETNMFSEFKKESYVILDSTQLKMRYLMEFHVINDEIKKLDDILLKDSPIFKKNDEDEDTFYAENSVDINQFIKLPDTTYQPKAEMIAKDSKTGLPLKSVHIRATLIDLASEVTVIQEFTNTSSTTIEGKYVFPLSEKAVVCGFEAFTEGRHFIGRIEEKEEAVKEYREAVQAGQKAYLMEEEAPDIFSVNIGNISSGATVIIKITYVTELTLEGDLIKFSIPSSVSPIQNEESLTQQQQQQSSTVSANVQNAADFDSSIEIFLDMPFPIRLISSATHKLIMKKTETKAVIKIDKNSKLLNGFQLLIGLSEIHSPRMWIEESNKGTSDACMLVFYPEFDVDSPIENEIILALDASNSMKENFKDAQTIATLCLHLLPENCKFNVVRFGTVFEELFPVSCLKSMDAIEDAKRFVSASAAKSGNSNIRHVLHSYNLLPPKPKSIRNFFIISDGHFNCPDELFSHAHKNEHHTRIFTFGIGSDANNHQLRGLATSGSGGFENFERKQHSKWGSKVKLQIEKAMEPVLTDVGVEWKTYQQNVSPPIQAPNVITCIFNGSRLVVYGLVSHCNLASLKAKVEGNELSSIVYTSELSKTKGSTLHCLATRALVDDWSYGNLHLNRSKHELLKRRLKPEIINLSKTFSIVTPLTSFVAVEDKDSSVDHNTQYSLNEILNALNVDHLPYIQYDIKEEPIFNSLSTQDERKDIEFKCDEGNEGNMLEETLQDSVIDDAFFPEEEVKITPKKKLIKKKAKKVEENESEVIEPVIQDTEEVVILRKRRPPKIAKETTQAEEVVFMCKKSPNMMELEEVPIEESAVLEMQLKLTEKQQSLDNLLETIKDEGPQGRTENYEMAVPEKFYSNIGEIATERTGTCQSFSAFSMPPIVPYACPKSLYRYEIAQAIATEFIQPASQEEGGFRDMTLERDTEEEDFRVMLKRKKKKTFETEVHEETSFKENTDSEESIPIILKKKTKPRRPYNEECEMEILNIFSEENNEKEEEDDPGVLKSGTSSEQDLSSSIKTQFWKKLPLITGSLSLGSGLPFVSELLKSFPREWWTYKDVSMYLSTFTELNSSGEETYETSEELENFLKHSNDYGGINRTNIPEDFHHLFTFIDNYLQKAGIVSLANPIQEAVLNLLATLTTVMIVCQMLIDHSLPPSYLNDPTILKEQADYVICRLCEYRRTIQLSFYGLLMYCTWINRRYPLIYRTLELGNNWESALINLIKIYDESERRE